jgi:DASH complex subunit ASK1
MATIEDIPISTPLPESDCSDSDSLDEIHNTAHPSTAFLLASQKARRHSSNSDDSFDSSIDSAEDSLSQEPVHPFAREVVQDGFDDSFDNDFQRGGGEEETVFGHPSAERRQPQGARPSELKMLGGHLLDDTLGIGAQIAKSGLPVEETPTPWGRIGRG